MHAELGGLMSRELLGRFPQFLNRHTRRQVCCVAILFSIHDYCSVLSYKPPQKFAASNQTSDFFSRASRKKDARVQNAPRDREGTRGGPPTMADFTVPVLHDDVKSYGQKRH